MLDDAILTTREAAKLLGVSVRTVQTWVEEGVINSWKTPGGHRRVRESAVLALRERRIVQPTRIGYTVLIIASDATAERCIQILAELPEVRVTTINDALLGLIEAGHLSPAAVVIELDRMDWERLALLNRLQGSQRLAHSRIVVISDLQPGELRLDLETSRISILNKTLLPTEVRMTIAPYQNVPAIAATRYPVPKNEMSRLQAVARTQLQNSAEQSDLNVIATLVAASTKSPIALVTILTAESQLFKARHGLEALETPREWAFCNYTILQKGVFFVEDAQEDDRFRANPLVTGGIGIRAYAGAPIVDYEGFPLGSLCVISRKPRRFKVAERAALQTLAAAVSDKINLALHGRQLKRV
ncbi:excisionase family DNA-binding protein [Robbsia sp. KACC 23696]|uniref:excisionase family DNA-binding protein n=1 Tax=Robbsia sp. KACC 23696 TaxID=3149231 RepID=UPI00325AEF4D